MQPQEEEPKYVQFSIESRILKELGERLVSDAHVALTELIKNAYDADASLCRIEVSDTSIVVDDDGNGMSFQDFKSRWMRIATGNKAKNAESVRFNRKLTGSKGVGRFAVRFLGKHLLLESISEDGSGKKTKLSASFDWTALDEQEDILKLNIPYKLTPTNEGCGTKLTITKLRVEVDQNQLHQIKSGVLEITSPIYAFIKDAPQLVKKRLLELMPADEDPGFNVTFSNSPDQTISEDKNLASDVLANYVIKATLNLTGNTLNVSVEHFQRGAVFNQPFSIQLNNTIGCEVYADIRYFPRRAGVFLNKGIDGFAAWHWVRANNGVGVYDRGFRVKPYGMKDDDWLFLDADTAHSERKWRTQLMTTHFPMDAEVAREPSLNPMVGLPTTYQTVGAVFVNSISSDDSNDKLLIPSMDRQGYVANQAFDQLQTLIRFTVELIAHFDKKIIREDKDRERDEMYAARRNEIDAVVKEIRSSASLTKEDKDRITTHYQRIKADVEKLDDYDRSARESLEVMSLLGVVAGFMTHEYQAALMNLESAASLIKSLAGEDGRFAKYAESIDDSIKNFTGYIDYTKMFVSNLHLNSVKPYRVLPTLQHVISTFSKFQDERNIAVDLSGIDKGLIAPLVPVAMYQGIVHNLYTNALKVLLNERTPNKIICIQAWNERKKHVLQVLDNGPGIPPEVRNRIWDPLYTTTSSENNPLGSGMGLGLPLIKKVVEGRKGSIALVEPPPGFSTCFRVELPLED